MRARPSGDAEAAASVADRNLEYGLLVFYGEAIIAMQSSLWLTTGRHARQSRMPV
ncbi:hypothetical protein QE374_000358 [Microbacterium sp. SORGH_AS428]|uniref:hypothetical protein n=1 Tax=Microbacterium sp. SORGH_AS_0428 TaxID=3041788 RepID=UPI00285B1F33|nr:hypothetical protein [Microbacterium sp. SORGH_AS_0428]MDR6198449.1 hypothetical protein [Microbacterium sp. SORGH_AS_0428]